MTINFEAAAEGQDLSSIAEVSGRGKSMSSSP